MLHLVLHGLTKRQADAAQLAFLAVDEHLVDIGDDLFDYEVLCWATPPLLVSTSLSKQFSNMGSCFVWSCSCCLPTVFVCSHMIGAL